MKVQELNELDARAAFDALMSCCGSREWTQRMTTARPYASIDAVLDASDRNWLALGEDDWLEAFAAHPRIGERSESAWSQHEQEAALKAEDAIRNALIAANTEYERRFGFIFIVFASGKSPAQIIDLMRQRLNNDRATEIHNASAEQMQITRLRLRRLLNQDEQAA